MAANKRPYSQRWTDAHGADRNKRRREVYQRDSAVREANAQRAKEWRQQRANGAKVEREIYRFIDGKNVRVYSLGQIADQTQYAANTLRLLVQNGDLPEPQHTTGTHRYYTREEVKAIKAILKARHNH